MNEIKLKLEVGATAITVTPKTILLRIGEALAMKNNEICSVNISADEIKIKADEIKMTARPM